MDIDFIKERVARLHEELKLLESEESINGQTITFQSSLRYSLKLLKAYGNHSTRTTKDYIEPVNFNNTVNAGDKIEQRSIKDIKLFFDASINDNFVLTYDRFSVSSILRNLPKAIINQKKAPFPVPFQ